MRHILMIPLALATALLTACGGGGGGSTPAAVAATPAPTPVETPPSSLASAASLAQQCNAPRPGTTDRQGSIDTEKAWVRSFMDETYLWYKDIPVVNAADYTLAGNGNSVLQALNAYFQALKTKNTTATGKPVDQFSFTLSTATATSVVGSFLAPATTTDGSLSDHAPSTAPSS